MRRHHLFTAEAATLLYLNLAAVALAATILVLREGLSSPAPVWATALTSPWSAICIALASHLRPSLAAWPSAIWLLGSGALVNAVVILGLLKAMGGESRT